MRASTGGVIQMRAKTLLLAASLLALAGPCLIGSSWADEPDGLILPPGFHASVVADHLGVLRHLAFRDANDLYVSTQWNAQGTSGDLIAIHLDADHKADKSVHFGAMGGGTGIGIYRGALYAASTSRIYRYSFHGKDLVPISEPALRKASRAKSGRCINRQCGTALRTQPRFRHRGTPL